MNCDDQFENSLRRQPLRTIPPAWREEILAAAEAHRRPAVIHAPTLAALLGSRLRELFWPAPQAWAGLAAIWLVILGANFVMHEPSPRDFALRAAPSAQVMREMLKEQQQLFAELVGPEDKSESDRPKPLAPQPRSQRRDEFLNA